MNCSPALKLTAVLLLVALTFGSKIWITSRTVDPREIEITVAEFLSRNEFRVEVDKVTFTGQPVVVTATSDQCQMSVVETRPLGDPVDPLKYLVTDGDHTFVVFRGTIYDEEPLLLTTANYVWYTLLCRLGLATQIPRVLAVISSCDAAKLPWSDLAGI